MARRQRKVEAGAALLVALFVLLLLSAMAATMSVRLMTENRANVTYRSEAQGYYSALAGLEEARARLVPAAPDAIPNRSLPKIHLPWHTHVAYIVNGTADDPVDPDDPASRYFDNQFRTEFPSGGKRTKLHPSNQPNAQTPFAIPYKWVRITLKTEYSSQLDVNQDGVLDSSTPILFDGTQQRLAGGSAEGWLVYKVTALAVQPSGTRRMLQSEVAGRRWFVPSAAIAAGGSVQLTGEMTISGLNNCGGSADLYGVVSAGDVTLSNGATAEGQPEPSLANSTQPIPSPTELLAQLIPFAIPIQDADPANISFDPGSQTYFGSWVSLGDLTQFPPSEDYPALPAVVYADHSVSISKGQGAGILLVDGDLQIQGTFKYYGLVVATGAVHLIGNGLDPVRIYGAVFPGGMLVADGGGVQGIDVRYDSCGLAVGAEPLPKTVLAFKDLGR